MAKRIMVRSAEDDFCALRMMDAMESAGADVFALTISGTDTYEGARLPHQRFQVWAKVENEQQFDLVDEAIESEFSKENA